MEQDKSVMTTNRQKYENYREQFKRLEKALTYQFYLEALFIAYAIMEDRSEAILRYEENQIMGEKISIDRKLKKIVKIAEEKNSLANRYFKDELIMRALNWKEERNRLIHALMKQCLTTQDLAELAEDGKAIARELSSKATAYKRAVARRDGKVVYNCQE